MSSDIGNDDWGRLSPLLDQALEMDPRAREPWLASLHASQPALASLLRQLLDEKTEVDSLRFLEGSPAGAFAPGTLTGQRIGAYEIEGIIGQGGMGTVWLARRADGRYEGKTAVKLLNASLIGGPAEQHFIREGSVLAALEHPNIAHLVDAGVSAGGQPYLILEHVEGNPIDLYCKEERLGVRAILGVFLDVLAAVAYAHRHLVVHRDIKPSNVLVTAHGVVKLLDFGIAALLDEPGSTAESRGFTLGISAALTPEYAAPEQLLGHSVTTATDVYALGRVLYVLLGGPPTDMQRISRAEAARHTLEREPPLLSEGAPPASRRLLRGDLDNIVRKALKADPAERYATVEAFADDLRRYLSDEPVSARPDSLAYRAGKFVRRHRGGVLSGTVTALALVAITAFALLQMREAERQRDLADAQRQRSDGYGTAITSLLSQVGPEGRALRPEELLERAVQQVEATYSDDPAFLVHMLILISGRYYDLQNTRLEHWTLIKAEQAARDSGDPLLLYKVHCNTVETELAAGRRAAAVQRINESLELKAIVGEVPPLDQAACLRAQAEMAKAGGNMGAALSHLDEARDVLEKSGYTKGNVYAGILSMLAGYNGEAGNVLRAHHYAVKLVELDKRLGRQDSMPGLIARGALATIFRELGQVKRAASMHEEAAADHAATGPGKMLYGELLSRLGRPEEAVSLLRDALEEIDRSGHEVFRVRARLALTEGLLAAGDFGDAEQTLQDAATLMLADELKYDRRLIDAHRLRAGILLGQERLDEAEAELAHARKRHADGKHGDLAEARLLLLVSRLQLARARPGEAAAAARAALELFESITLEPEQSADVGEALLALALAQLAMDDGNAARQSLARASLSLHNGLGADHSLTLMAGTLAAESR